MTRTATILLVEGKRASQQATFAVALQKRYVVLLAHTGKQAVEILAKSHPDVIILNAASLRTSGVRICRSLRRQVRNNTPIILIQLPALENAHTDDADMVLKMPFTSRKLNNRIQHFLEAHEGETLVAGPFSLTISSCILTIRKTEIRLTPKMCTLLELFFRNPNSILSRTHLMSEVWDTDYMGDTRTLDVHIRWIREKLEKNPSKPKYLRTIRGKGYMLAV